MRIAKIIIKGFQQFENFHLDLEDPETGLPPDKVCFIGPNATGKTTLLNLILVLLHDIGSSVPHPKIVDKPFFAVKIHDGTRKFFACANLMITNQVYYDHLVEQSEEWQRFVIDQTQQEVSENFCADYLIDNNSVPRLTDVRDLIIEVTADQRMHLENDPPATSLNDALKLFKNFPVHHGVSISSAARFWDLLIYHIKKRESDKLQYLDDPKNEKKSVEEVKAAFEKSNPEILPEIGKLWNRVLEKAGLEFDVEAAQIPVQLNENLQAFVKIKASGKQLRYNELSSGIRNYIFRLGHIRALYFQRKIERGFLLVDEPENSLYPDILYGLVDDYLSIIENTQLFMATHNPIIAAQFKPHERIHLDFDDRGFVTATHGVTPIGDDPNDLLIKDFHVRSVYGKEGIQNWERFLELRRLIPETSDTIRKQQLIDEYLKIGNAYNFDPDEIHEKV
ncbi:MAG: ATP-binding protein [Blastocatellia bacterium]|nr:ATP-binding protein [Blastocatellia bacterium]